MTCKSQDLKGQFSINPKKLNMSAEFTIIKNGPVKITGRFVLTGSDGKRLAVEGEEVQLCRCGGSKNKPFCDGSHHSNGFKG